MKRLSFLQGSPQWHAHRATARNASEASAMLGCSPHMTRTDLLHYMHTGLRPEPTREQQRIFAEGHAIEAAQRETAAALIGEPLYPVVGSEVLDGLELSASFDGLTMAEDVAYEAKSLNDDLRAALPHQLDPDLNEATNLPKHYRTQMEQQLMVSAAERVLFVAANLDGSDVRRCWYYPDPALRAEILAGWRQFEEDLKAYVPSTEPAALKLVAEPVQALPAVVVTVSGQIALQDNFKAFEERLREFLEHRLIREPKTDQDFVDLGEQIKAMKQAEAALEAAEANMVAQIQSVDQAKKTKAMLLKLVADNRIMAEKLLSAEKERRKTEIVTAGASALRAHIDGLNQRLGKAYMPTVAADFGGVIKGLKSLASMEEKVATELARAKIEANRVADAITLNLQHLAKHPEHAHLFPDERFLVLKAPEDFAAAVAARIAADQQRQEAERERIRREEADRVERDAAAKAEAERRAEEARQRAAAPPPTPSPAPAASTAPAAAPAPVVVPLRPARELKLGDINAALAPVSVTAEGLARLGIHHCRIDRAAKLYDTPLGVIVDTLVAHLRTVASQREAA